METIHNFDIIDMNNTKKVMICKKILVVAMKGIKSNERFKDEFEVVADRVLDVTSGSLRGGVFRKTWKMSNTNIFLK